MGNAFTGLIALIKEDGKALIKSLLQALGVVLFINWAFFQLSIIPTGSMIPTILEGDVVLVSKLHYGAKTPQTLLHIPFTQEKIPFTNLPSYLTWIQLPVYGLPGLSKPKRGDCVVIRRPQNTAIAHIPTDVQVPFLKRIIGMPQDKFSIVAGKAHVNGRPVRNFTQYQYRYIIKTDQRLPHSFFKKNNLTHYEHLAAGGAEVYTTEAQAERLRNIASINDVVRIIQKVTTIEKKARFAWLAGGNKDHIPEFTIPYQGMEIVINEKSLACYLDIIKNYEIDRSKKVSVQDGRLWIAGKEVTTYRFKQSYYFVMGDNRDNSHDSRFFGLVPEIDMLGKPIIKLLSCKNPKRHIVGNLLTLNIRWGQSGKVIR